MLARASLLIPLLLATVAVAADAPRTYGAAEAIWKRTRNRPQYVKFGEQFIQFNNHFHLDEKNGCYALDSKPVSLLLVITHSDGGKYALVERALTDTDTAKARCFRQTYEGLETGVPPYLPFVFQMRMG